LLRLLATLVLAFGVLAVPLMVEAQQPKVYRVGILLQESTGTPATRTIRAMLDLGYTMGQNFVIDYRWADGKNERFPSLAAELVALKPDVIVVETTPGTIAAMRATATIPIVMFNVSDPVGSGLVASLARPGGNITGVTDFGIELAVKSVEMMRSVVPNATRLAVLMSDNPVHSSQLKEIEAAAKTMGLSIQPTMAVSSDEFEKAFASMAKQKAEMCILLGGAPFSTQEQVEQIIRLAAKAKLPMMFESPWPVELGGLMSYSPNRMHRARTVASYVDKILKGAKPADMPVQRPSVFDLVINLKTARALGLSIPQAVRVRAEVIE
jgi:putative ABC transport system substrate-binding protein